LQINEITKDDEVTKRYLSEENLDKMHKCVLAIENQESLENLHKNLSENGISHKMWIEMPENFPTCLALKPYEKEQVQDYFKDLKLMR
jgi:peptidyl-tRNA hydrolase